MSRMTVIIGAGQAGVDVATSLRQQQYEGRIVLISDEPDLPYRRPPLSKAYLAGQVDATSLAVVLRPETAYAVANIELLLSAKVERIDRQRRQVLLADGREYGYDNLVLATGGRPRRLTIPGAQARNVHYLRTLADADALRAELVPGRRVVLVGAGYIGLEIAATAVKLGLQVAVLECAPRVLARVTAPAVSAFYERVHREAGVDLRVGVTVREIACEGDRARAVVLEDGTRFDADLIVAGVGLEPNIELARDAGIDVGDGLGILVDEHGRTSDPAVFAAGDCTSQPDASLGRRIRLESVANAMEQARVVAAAISGKDIPRRSPPWFWSDQYDVKLQMVGATHDYEEIVMRGNPEERSFCVFYLKQGVLVAVDAVNRPGEFDSAKRMVAARTVVRVDEIADENFELA